MSKGLMDSSRVDINLATFKTGGEVFQVVVDPDLAIDLKHGKEIDIREVLKSEAVFSDAQKGMRASEIHMKQLFGTSEPIEVAKLIIEKGDIQLSAEYRKQLRELKRNRILDIIHTNSINPQTKTPHPRERLEAAIDEAKVHIDEFKKAEDQVEGVVEALRKLLPIRFEQLMFEVLVEAKFAPQAYSILKSLGSIEDSEWTNAGGLLAKVKLPAGLQEDFMNKLNSLTHGNVSIKLIEK
jgi:ribosome maturation protein SDO1